MVAGAEGQRGRDDHIRVVRGRDDGLGHPLGHVCRGHVVEPEGLQPVLLGRAGLQDHHRAVPHQVCEHTVGELTHLENPSHLVLSLSLKSIHRRRTRHPTRYTLQYRIFFPIFKCAGVGCVVLECFFHAFTKNNFYDLRRL